jgi:hypothetical protein
MFLVDYVKNLNFVWCYKNSETIFKVIYDKYYRNDIYEEINRSNLGTIKKNKSILKDKIFSDLKMKNDVIKLLKVDDNTLLDEEEFEIENKSFIYLKNNLNVVRSQLISLSLTSTVVLSVALSFPIKSIRRSKYSQPLFFFTVMNLMLFNANQILKVNEINKQTLKFLELNYKRQIEKYNIIIY